MDNLFPVMVSVPRKGGMIVIAWAEGTDDDFVRAVQPLVRIGETVLQMEKKSVPQAGGAAHGTVESSEKDSVVL